MPPPWTTNPAPRTESAKEARRAFFCDLCQKGYSRSNEFEAHEGSYDHQHKKRLKEMKALTRDPNAAQKARRAEEKADGNITIKPISLGSATKDGKGSGGSGFKKGGFRNAFAPVDAPETKTEVETAQKSTGPEVKDEKEVETGNDSSEHSHHHHHHQDQRPAPNVQNAEPDPASEIEDDVFGSAQWGDYDPARPTGCGPGCAYWESMNTASVQ